MPEQPEDPLHYDMKIPPETHDSDDDEDADGAESGGDIRKTQNKETESKPTESAKDHHAVGSDKP